jgi:hypothetical protein
MVQMVLPCTKNTKTTVPQVIKTVDKHKILDSKLEDYADIWVEDGMLKLQLLKSSAPNWTITMDAKVIPQFKDILEKLEDTQ